MVADDSLKGLLNQLDSVAAAARREAVPRQISGPRVPHLEDQFLSGGAWQPPPSKKDIKEEAARAKSSYRPPFCQYNNTAGDAFASNGRLKPCILGVWAQQRVVQPDKVFTTPKGFKGYRGHHQSEPISEPHDGMCSTQHRTWLQSHYAQRDKHLFPAYHALGKLDELQKSVPNIETLIKRAPPCEAEILVRKHQKLKEQIVKVKSEPALRVRVPTPDGEFRHVRRWAGNDMSGTWLQKSTYGRDQDENRQIALQKSTYGQASFKHAERSGQQGRPRRERAQLATTITTTFLPADVHAVGLFSEAGNTIVGM